MQKLINGIALLSGLVSISILGGGAYLYVQKDALIEGAKEKVAAAAAEAITGALPGMIDSAMPEIPEPPSFPKTTGSPMPF